MPQVTVTTGGNDREVVAAIQERLRMIVAEELTCSDPDGSLVPDDVEVEFRDRDPDDISNFMLQIHVMANDYPGRRVNLDERQAKITERVAEVYRELPVDEALSAEQQTGYVWVTLHPGSFGTFNY